MQTIRIDTHARCGRAMPTFGLIGIISAMAACGLEPRLLGDGESTAGADTSTTSMASESTDTAETPDTDTESSGGSDGGSDDGSDDESDGADDGPDEPDFPDCEPGDETVVAQFSVAVDGVPIVIDYSQAYVPDTNIPGGWSEEGWDPEIDGPCQVLAFEPDQGSISLLCDDTVGISRTVDLTFSSSPVLAPELAVDEVELYYVVQREGGALNNQAGATLHTFALWADTELVLAGIDGRFRLHESLASAWPTERLYCLVTWGDCLPRSRARVRVRMGLDYEGATPDGGFAAVGDHLLVVETALLEEQDPQLPESFDAETIRLLVGPPA